MAVNEKRLRVTEFDFDQVKENLIQEHFDDKDTTLLGDKSVIN